MFKLADYIHEIWTLAKIKDVPIGIAYDMFRVDVATGTAENTEGCLPDFDFAAASVQWNKLNEVEKLSEYEQWHYILRYGYSDFVRTYPIREDMLELVEELRAEYLAKWKREQLDEN